MNHPFSRSALLLSLLVSCAASAQNQNPSIMFQQNNDQGQMMNPAPSELEAKCTELARQIELLRGKPQRRYIAIQRYDLECKGGSIDYDRLDSEGTSR